MIHVKEGVKFSCLRRRLFAQWEGFERIFAQAGIPMRITCGTDGHDANDPHSHGFAIDLDTHNIPGQARELTRPEKRALVVQLQSWAGLDHFIFLENEGLESEHIHWQIRKDLWPGLVTQEEVKKT